MNTFLEALCEKINAAPAPDPAPAPARRILLVDDDVLLLELNAGVLASSGYTVDTAADGADAWKALHDVNYDLLITDNKMPRVTGLELIKKLRSENMTLPVILASGTLSTEELMLHAWQKLDATLAKPFTIAELLDAVKNVLLKVDSAANSARLFRQCALLDDKIAPARKPAAARNRDRTSQSHRILVVDDDKNARELSVDVLKGFGYHVEGAKDGAAGWKALQARSYDLVVTDNKMPNMTGIEMIAALRYARMAVPVIMATGILPLHEFADKPWLKPDAMLQRPFSTDDLLNTVKSVLSTDGGNGNGQGTLVPQPA